MKTYYSDSDIEITDEHIKLGSKTFQVRDVESFDVRPMFLATLMSWRFLPVLIALCLFAVNMVVTVVRLADVFSGRGGRPDSIYAQDWTDFLIPLAFVVAAPGLIFIDKITTSFGVVLRGARGKLSSYVTSDTKLIGEISSALGSALKEAKIARGPNSNRAGASSNNALSFYSSPVAEVTGDLIVLMGREYSVSDIQEIQIRKEVSQSRVSEITSLLFGLIFMAALIPQMLPLFSTQPVVVPGGIQFPVAWLKAFGLVAFAVTWAISLIRRGVNKSIFSGGLKPIYVIMLWGRLGLHNREVILSTEAFRSVDKVETHKIAEAISQAITRKRSLMNTSEQLSPDSNRKHQVRRVAIANYRGR